MPRVIAVSTALAAALCAPPASSAPSSIQSSSPDPEVLAPARPQLEARPPLAPAARPGEESQGVPYGIDAGAAVGPYLNGVFPDAEPGSADTFTPRPVLGGLTFDEPMDLASHPNASAPGAPYLFVSERAGRVWAIHEDDTRELFLDVTDRCTEAGDGGFMGLAPHPNFGLDGAPGARFVYAFYGYAHDPGALIGVNEIGFYGAYTRLSRFEVPPGSSTVDPASETVMFQLRLLNSSHRGGDIAFGPDGMLYVPMGNQFEFGAGQDLVDNLAGGVLRIDVDRDPSRSHPPTRTFPLSHPDEWSGVEYWIPDDNPFLDGAGARFEEYWCLGLRNPHRMDFDEVTGDLWIGEVGSIQHEEVNVIVPGANYGFPFREGFGPGPVGAPGTFDGVLTDPVVEFERADATALIGGFVYRGSLHPGLHGKFLCIDHVRDRMFAVGLDPASGSHEAQVIGTFTPENALSFGRDRDGEILIGTLAPGAPLYTLEANQAVPEPPSRLSELSAFTDLSTLIPATGWIPYDLNAPFWSDGAVKSRWVAIPNDGVHDEASEKITRALRNGSWKMPPGTVTMKHFELPVNAASPRETRRLETRFLVFTEDGHYGLSYHWLADGSDALLADEARSEAFDVMDANGNTMQQVWDFPGRLDCRTCHGPGTGGALGLRTHQLNRSFVYATGVSDNQLRAWNHIGLFATPMEETQIPTLPRAVSPDDTGAPLDLRVQSYLDANCASCHGTGGAGRAAFDARFSTPLYAKDLIFGEVEDDLGFGDAHPVAPLAPARSLALHRLELLDGAAMPPLAKNVVDPLGVDLLSQWIETIPPYLHVKLGGETTPADGTDTWPWHAVVDMGSAHTIENPTTTALRAEAFRFHARHALEALTPFVARLDGAGGFEVLAIGDSFLPKTYTRGANRLPFSSAGPASMNVAAGDTVVAGFLNRALDGSEPAANGLGPTIPYSSCAQPGAAAWTSGGGSPDELPRIRQGELVIPGHKTEVYSERAYSFAIDIVEVEGDTAPVFERLISRTARVNDTVSWQLKAIDYEGATVKFPEVAGLPQGLQLDDTTGLITGSLDAQSVGEHLVAVTASDGTRTTVGTFRVTVLP